MREHLRGWFFFGRGTRGKQKGGVRHEVLYIQGWKSPRGSCPSTSERVLRSSGNEASEVYTVRRMSRKRNQVGSP